MGREPRLELRRERENREEKEEKKGEIAKERSKKSMGREPSLELRRTWE